MTRNTFTEDELPNWGTRSPLDWERQKTDELVVWLIQRAKLSEDDRAELERRLSTLKQIRG